MGGQPESTPARPLCLPCDRGQWLLYGQSTDMPLVVTPWHLEEAPSGPCSLLVHIRQHGDTTYSVTANLPTHDACGPMTEKDVSPSSHSCFRTGGGSACTQGHTGDPRMASPGVSGTPMTGHGR